MMSEITITQTDFADTDVIGAGEPKVEAKVEYGPTGDGEYITPYQMTVVYHDDSPFETAVATLTKAGQMIPLGEVVDFNTVAASCEHISPEVLIFGPQFSREALGKFYEKGFQFIHIFARDVEAAKAKYYDNNAPYDERMVVFGIDELYSHVILLDGMITTYVLEHVICASFPTYQSIVGDKEINHLNGRYFMSAIEGNVGLKLLQICSTYRGFDITRDLVIRGRTINDVREIIANKKIATAVPYKLVSGENEFSAVALDTTGVSSEIMNLLPIHPFVKHHECNIAVFYCYEPHKIDDIIKPGWRITLMTLSSTTPSMLEMLREFAPNNVTGGHGLATAWIATGDPLLLQLLNFWQ